MADARSSGDDAPVVRFERMLRDHEASLRRLAAIYEWDAHEREDLLQEIWLALWRALPSYRGDCSERTFVFRIGHNRGLTHRWRRRAPPSEPDAAAAIPDPSPLPDELASRAHRAHRLLDAVRRLPASQRDVVVLSLEGLSHREIAEVLGTTENGVAIRLTRARKALRELLEPVRAGEGEHV